MENNQYSANLKFIASLLLTLSVGALGGFFTFSEIPTWYATLVKPSFNPPNTLFGPVWTTLYVMMGYSLYLIWRLPSSPKKTKALWIFVIQLILNSLWSFVFFKCHALFAAIIEIVALWLSIVYTIFFLSTTKKSCIVVNTLFIMGEFCNYINNCYLAIELSKYF